MPKMYEVIWGTNKCGIRGFWYFVNYADARKQAFNLLCSMGDPKYTKGVWEIEHMNDMHYTYIEIHSKKSFGLLLSDKPLKIRELFD